MGSLRFSVIIPTRERAETLVHTLRTCLDQDFDGYEVVVCDNGSSPATRRVVDEFASSRVRYVRASEPLAMNDNWELAVSHARGEYLTILGDDDGLMPYALKELDRLATQLDVPALRWEPAFYTWPTIALASEANYLRIPTSREVQILDSPSAIRSAISFTTPYTRLPTIYNAMVRRELVEELRQRSGRVFGHLIPDVYSGFALGYLAKRYASVDVPMTVAGLSRKSNGVALLFVRGPSAVSQDFETLNRRRGLAAHPWVPDLPIFPPVPVADAFLAARAALFPDDPELCLDRKAFLEGCVRGIPAEDEAMWRRCLGVIRDTLHDEPELQCWFDATPKEFPASRTLPRLRADRLGFDGTFLHLDTKAHGVEDVAGAVRLCETILNYRGTEVVYDLMSAHRYEQERGAAEVRWHDYAQNLQQQLLDMNRDCERLRDAFQEYRSSTAHRLADQARDLVRRIFRRAG